jgi:hypothetical protein
VNPLSKEVRHNPLLGLLALVPGALAAAKDLADVCSNVEVAKEQRG